MDDCLIYNHLPHFSFMSLIYCYTSAGIAWLPQQHKKMLEQTNCVSYNEVCIIVIRQGLENIKTFWPRPRPKPRLFLQDQDQHQDFYFKAKTKTKTIFHVLEAPQDQDQSFETTSLVTHLVISRCNIIGRPLLRALCRIY